MTFLSDVFLEYITKREDVMAITRMYAYRDIIKEYFYLDSTEQLRRSCDGYQMRYRKGDLVVPFTNRQGYQMVQIPKVRTSIMLSHVHAILLDMNVPVGYEIDHKDGDVTNNHSSNLRIVTKRVNACNRKKRADNTSGITGIRWSDYHKHYVIRRTVNGERLSTSRKTLEEAIQVLKEFTKRDPHYTTRHGK